VVIICGDLQRSAVISDLRYSGICSDLHCI